MEIIDEQNQPVFKKALWSVRLFTLSLALTIITLAFALSDAEMGISHKLDTKILGISVLLALGSSFIGFVLGFFERKYNKWRALLGIIGNLFVLMFILFMIIVINEALQFGPP